MSDNVNNFKKYLIQVKCSIVIGCTFSRVHQPLISNPYGSASFSQVHLVTTEE